MVRISGDEVLFHFLRYPIDYYEYTGRERLAFPPLMVVVKRHMRSGNSIQMIITFLSLWTMALQSNTVNCVRDNALHVNMN